MWPLFFKNSGFSTDLLGCPMENVNSENGTNRLTPTMMHLKKKEQGGLYSFAHSEWRCLSTIRNQLSVTLKHIFISYSSSFRITTLVLGTEGKNITVCWGFGIFAKCSYYLCWTSLKYVTSYSTSREFFLTNHQSWLLLS